MPVNKRTQQLVLGLLSLEQTPVSLEQLHNSVQFIGQSIQNLSLAVRTLWENGQIIRSSKKINGRYYYFLSNEEMALSVNETLVKFNQYKNHKESTHIKERIKLILLKSKVALRLKDICIAFDEKYDDILMKRIQFHLKSLVNSSEVSRQERPFQYYLSNKKNSISINSSKLSIPEQIVLILQGKNQALASSEIADILNSNSMQVKPAALSLALNRLYNSGRIHKSSIRLGARRKIRGHLFALDSKLIEQRLKKIKEVRL
jgi:Fe2+ or Zn2+ uptake regulation protein